MKLWILYSFDYGYPEDPKITPIFFRACKTEGEAEEIQKLSYDARRTRFPEWKDWRENSRKTLKEKYGLDYSDVPEHLEIMEIELKE